MSGPLDGIRIVDFGRAATAPYAALVLGELGAEIIKIEPMEGNFDRKVGGPHRGGVDGFFLSTNRGKRSVALDLRSDEGRAAALDIMVASDAVVANFRPGVLAKMGLSYAEVSERNDRVVFVDVNGFGSTGPYRDQPAYDPVIQALSGMIDMQRRAGVGRPDVVHTVVVDKLTALFTANAIQAGLLARERHGKGQYVEVVMLEAAIHFLWPDAMAHRVFVGDHTPGYQGSRSMEPTECANGAAVYMAMTMKQRHGLLRAVGREDLVEDPRFATSDALREIGRLPELYKIIAEQARPMTKEQFVDALHEQGVPCAAILDTDEVIAHEQVQALGMLTEWDSPVVGTIRSPIPPMSFSHDPIAPDYSMAVLGEDGVDILEEVGWEPDRIRKLVSNGQIITPPPGAE